MSPGISIIVNCFNGEAFLREAIDSIINQTYEDWEVIFFDNQSSDKSVEIIQSYKDPRIKLYHSKRFLELGEARKLAFEQTKGVWIAFLDTDDYWYPQKLEKQMNLLQNESYILCYGGIHEINSKGKILKETIPQHTSGQQLELQLRQFEINMVTPLILKKAMKDHQIFFDKNIIASEEYNLFLRLSARGKFLALPEVLGCWRIYSGSLTDRSIEHWWKDRAYTLKQLVKENPSLRISHAKSLDVAWARCFYYQARYFRMTGDFLAGAKTLFDAAKLDKIYYCLLIAWVLPFAWQALHSQKIKRKFVPIVMDLIRKI